MISSYVHLLFQSLVSHFIGKLQQSVGMLLVQTQLGIVGLVKGHGDCFLGDAGQDPSGQLTVFVIQTHDVTCRSKDQLHKC